MPTSPDVQCDQILLPPKVAIGYSRCMTGKEDVQNSAVAGPDMYMYSRCMQGDPPPPIYFNNDD